MRALALSATFLAFLSGCGDGGAASGGGGGGDTTGSGATSTSSMEGPATSAGAGGAGGGGPTCTEPFLDCDPSVAGCETDITSNPAHCGECGLSCDVPGATPVCTNRTCGFVCLPDRDDCNLAASDGCEADLLTDGAHCGGCDQPCVAGANTVDALCDDGMCHVSCEPSFGDCDGAPGNGCEQQLGSVTHCTACNDACAPEGGTAVCYPGGCGLSLGPAPGDVTDLALDGTYVYLAVPASGIVRVPKSGGSLEAVVSGPEPISFVGVSGTDAVYPVSTGSSVIVRSTPVTGGPVTDLGTIATIGAPGGFAVGPTHAFVEVWGELWSVPLAGGAPALVSTVHTPPVVANGFVYYLHEPSHDLYASPEGGGAEIVVSTRANGQVGSASFLAVQATYAFVGNVNIDRVTLASGVKDSFGGIFLFTTELAADAQHVYFTSAYDIGGGEVYQSVRRRSVTNQNDSDFLTADYQGSASAIALDATHLYFAVGTTVGKVTK